MGFAGEHQAASQYDHGPKVSWGEQVGSLGMSPEVQKSAGPLAEVGWQSYAGDATESKNPPMLAMLRQHSFSRSIPASAIRKAGGLMQKPSDRRRNSDVSDMAQDDVFGIYAVLDKKSLQVGLESADQDARGGAEDNQASNLPTSSAMNSHHDDRALLREE